jgi:hypothetical protein
MSQTDTADGRREFKTIERPTVDGTVHASVEVDVGELSAPRTNRVHQIAAQFENRIAAAAGDDVDVTQLSNHSGVFAHIDCERVGMKLALDVSEVSERRAEQLTDYVVATEEAFFEAFEEVRDAAAN